MTRTILTTASAFALLTGAAFAIQEEAQMEAQSEAQTEEALPEVTNPEATVALLDATSVTTEEDARTFASTEFALADANADGSVDKAEFIAYAEANAISSTDGEAMNEPVGEGDASYDSEASIEATPEEAFAELSGGEDALTEEKIVDARVADFDEADANDDAQLDDAEKQQFAALVSGKTSS